MVLRVESYFLIGFKASGMIMTDKEFDDLFTRLDTAKSGNITYTEYLAGAADISLLQNEKILEEAFNFFDRDGNKSISRDEIRVAMQKGWMSENQLSDLFNEIDTNKDDKVLVELIKRRLRSQSSKR